MNQSVLIFFFQFSELEGFNELGTEQYFTLCYVRGANYIQEALDTKIVNSSLVRALFQIPFEGQAFFHPLIYVEDYIGKKLLFQHPLTALSGYTMQAGLGNVQDVLQPYIFYNNSTLMYMLIESLELGYALSPRGIGFFPQTLRLGWAPTVLVLLHR